MVGRWTGTAQSYFDPSKPPEVAPWEGKIEMLLGGRFPRCAYHSQAMGHPIAG